jgi:hypothetical protein
MAPPAWVRASFRPASLFVLNADRRVEAERHLPRGIEGFFRQSEKLAAKVAQAAETLKMKAKLLLTHQQAIQKIRSEIRQTHRLYVEGHVTSQGFGEFFKPAEERLNQLLAELPSSKP